MKLFLGIPLFLVLFNRSRGIGGECGVRLRVLAMISLFWYMVPRWSCANRSVFLERGGEIFQGVHPLEAVADIRYHMLFAMGWVGVGGWGRVTLI